MRSIPLIIILMSFFSQPLMARLRITIDPGHGGDDKGAIHHNVEESKVALQISKKLYQRLKKDPAFTTQLLRKKDKHLDLEDRVRMSDQFKSDIFLSIHANAHPSKRAKGMEIYLQNQLPIEEENRLLAHNEHIHRQKLKDKPKGDVETIIDDLNKSHRMLQSYQVSAFLRKNWQQKKYRMIRQGPFYVLNQNKAPSILVEVGYLSHPKERKQLIRSDYQQLLAKKIHLALKDYAKNMDKLPLSILQTQDAKTR